LQTNQTQYLGKLLALGNVRFIVFHNDSERGDLASVSRAFDYYFEQYTNHSKSFLVSDEYNYHFLSLNKTTGGIDDDGYLNFILYQKYLENYKNSSEYQALSSPESKTLIDSLSKLTNTNSGMIFDSLNNTIYGTYNSTGQYKNSSFYKNLPISRANLSNFLSSSAYQKYLDSFQSSTAHQNFIDSPIYNNTHDYLNSLEYLTLTGTQYFQNSPEYKNFIDSPEYRGFLYYYLFYSTEYQDFQKSSKYAEYQMYLNYNSMCSNMLSNLQSQRDLKLVTMPYTNDNESLLVFENTETMNYFQTYSKANLVLGGLDTVGSLSSSGDLYLNDSAFLFVENKHLSESKLASILNLQDLDKNLLFYDSKTFDDLVLDTIDTGDYLAPGELFVNTSDDWWLSNVVTSYSWTPITLSSYMGEKYDFGLGHNLLYTTNVGASFDLPLEIGKSDEYSIWLRLLFSPGGGKMNFSIEGTSINDTSINTASSVLNGFKWVNLGNITLNNGSHNKIKVTSESGLNAVNLVALPTVTKLEEHRQNVSNLIIQSNAKILYIMDKTFLNCLENNGTVSIFAPYASSYKISFQTNQPLIHSPLSPTVDNKAQSVFTATSFSDKNWYASRPFNLSQGYHSIDLSSLNVEKAIIYSVSSINDTTESLNSILGGGAESFVVRYEKSDPVSFSVAVNASRPFILGYQEPYDEFWQSNISSTNLVLNSVNNGYFVDSNSTNAVINITYSPEQSLQLGLKITLISFLATLTIISIALLYPKIRHRTIQKESSET